MEASGGSKRSAGSAAENCSYRRSGQSWLSVKKTMSSVSWFGIALARQDAVDLEPGQADLVGLVDVGAVEVGLARGGDAVALAGVAGVGQPVGAQVVVLDRPVQVLVAGPPEAGAVGLGLDDRPVGGLEQGLVVVGGDVGQDLVLAHDGHARPAVAQLVDDAVLVVVDAVGRVARGLHVGVAQVAGAAAGAGQVAAVAAVVPGVDQVDHLVVELAGEEGVVVVRLVDAVAAEGRSAHARVHVQPEDDVVVVVGRALVGDVVVPEDHVAGLGVGPLEAAHLDAQAQAAPRRVAAVGEEVPGVVVVVVQDHVALLVGDDLLAEVAVPGAGPARDRPDRPGGRARSRARCAGRCSGPASGRGSARDPPGR